MMQSPLRYPGGKSKLFPFFVELIYENQFYPLTYCEPYAGGGGLALKLLSHGYVSKIELNDIDIAIVSFWRSILYDTENFCRKIFDTPLSVEEWQRQKAIYRSGKLASELDLGFSAYYLNRTSRSGIIEGSGPIGGYAQKGNWLIDARMNRCVQEAQIIEIAKFSACISVFNLDALKFCNSRISSNNHFTYLDPPYYVKGNKLYKNFYNHQDHVEIANFLKNNKEGNWILSYDYTEEILKLYENFPATVYDLLYSAGEVGKGREVIYSGDTVRIPAFSGFEMAA
jgi:DNA adenine methylase